MKKTNKLALWLSVAFAVMLLWGQVYALLYTASQTWPVIPDGTTARFWRSTQAATYWTVTLTNKDTITANATILSLPFTLEGNNGVGGMTVPTELYFGGLYCAGTSATPCTDSITLAYWWYDASGDSGRLAPTDTCVFDTSGLGLSTADSKVAFLFKTSILEPEANAFIPSRIAVQLKVIDAAPAADSTFLDDCFLLGRWGN